MEFVKSECFKYVSSVVDQNNETAEVKGRINAGKKALRANKTFQRKLLSKGSELRSYWSAIRSIVAQACEAWVVLEVMRLGRRILRKTYGPTKLIDGTCRIETNEEHDDLIEQKYNSLH
jgi:hypothetical protein